MSWIDLQTRLSGSLFNFFFFFLKCRSIERQQALLITCIRMQRCCGFMVGGGKKCCCLSGHRCRFTLMCMFFFFLSLPLCSPVELFEASLKTSLIYGSFIRARLLYACGTTCCLGNANCLRFADSQWERGGQSGVFLPTQGHLRHAHRPG